MKIKKLLLPLSVFFVLATSSAYASDCSLNGVAFKNLSQPQIDAMKGAGAECKAKKQGAFVYGQQGYYIINGQKTDAIDVAANDPYDMDGIEATFYGYIGFSMTETPRHKIWGYRFDTELDEGKVQKMGSSSYINYGDQSVPLLFVANQYSDTVESAKADRIKFYKALSRAKSLGAAVKVTGTFRVFSNTGDLYMRGADIEVIQMKP